MKAFLFVCVFLQIAVSVSFPLSPLYTRYPSNEFIFFIFVLSYYIFLNGNEEMNNLNFELEISKLPKEILNLLS